MARLVNDALATPDLTLPTAERLLSVAVQYQVQVSSFYDSIENAAENDEIDLDAEDMLSEAAGLAYELIQSLQTKLLDKIRMLGGHPGRILDDLQREHGL